MMLIIKHNHHCNKNNVNDYDKDDYVGNDNDL